MKIDNVSLAPLALAACIAAPIAARAASPSFNCARAKSPSEIQICLSPRLAELDNILAAGYAFIKSTRGRPAADQIGVPYWRLIDQCRSDAACIATRQAQEIAALHLAGAPISLPSWAKTAPDAGERPETPTTPAHPTVVVDPASSSKFSALTGAAIRTRCHMDNCEWFEIDHAALLAESTRKSLFILQMTNWDANYPNGDYAAIRPREDVSHDTTYVVCSKTEPSIIYGSDSHGWTQTPLAPGAKDHMSGAIELILTVYWAACHAMNVQDVSSAAVVANKLGYPAIVPEDALKDRSLSDPMDAFGPH